MKDTALLQNLHHLDHLRYILVRLAKGQGIKLRQSYERLGEAPQGPLSAGRHQRNAEVIFKFRYLSASL